METLILWMKGLPLFLENALNIILIAIIFLTAFTITVGVWIGYFITRRRMNSIVELQFFPPKITFKENTNDNSKTTTTD